ncbi:MAG: xanthine dehydrogenase family protein subunit M [Deltaproteobacteria bacterium]|nr:xanthine dehydrogenase family protein subunit M [Deltaproteobacteria bacterium]
MKILEPKNLAHALKMKAENNRAEPIAGGTDLLASWSAGAEKPAVIILLPGLAELSGIRLNNGYIRIGACTTHAELASNPIITRHLPALAAAAAGIGAPAVRNMGTLGGNLVCPSPAADLPPVLLAFDAEAVAGSTAGERVVPFSEFFIDYRKVDLKEDELLLAVRIPVPADGIKSYFRKVGSRKSQTLAKVSLAARARVEQGKVIHSAFAAGSVGPTVVRLKETEALVESKQLDLEIIEQACKEAEKEICPIDDIRSTASYRRFALNGMVREFLEMLLPI